MIYFFISSLSGHSHLQVTDIVKEQLAPPKITLERKPYYQVTNKQYQQPCPQTPRTIA